MARTYWYLLVFALYLVSPGHSVLEEGPVSSSEHSGEQQSTVGSTGAVL
jgi:hypothetical protein